MKWKVETRKVDELRDYHKNPRKLSKSEELQLQASLKKYGQIDKIVINHDNVIIGGHQRKRTLKKLGLDEVEVMVPERVLSDDEVEELNIRLNKNNGSWDFDVLANDFKLDDLLKWGFDETELQIDKELILEETPISEVCDACGQKLKNKENK